MKMDDKVYIKDRKWFAGKYPRHSQYIYQSGIVTRMNNDTDYPIGVQFPDGNILYFSADELRTSDVPPVRDYMREAIDSLMKGL